MGDMRISFLCLLVVCLVIFYANVVNGSEVKMDPLGLENLLLTDDEDIKEDITEDSVGYDDEDYGAGNGGENQKFEDVNYKFDDGKDDEKYDESDVGGSLFYNLSNKDFEDLDNSNSDNESEAIDKLNKIINDQEEKRKAGTNDQ